MQFPHRPQRLAVTPDGTRLAVSDNRTQTTVTVIDPRSRKRVTTVPTRDNAGQVVGITPDGARVITFGPTNSANPVGRLAAYELASGTERVLTDAGDLDAPPPVSTPDGRWVAVITTRRAAAGTVVDVVDVFDTGDMAARRRQFVTTTAPSALAAGRTVLALGHPDGSVELRCLVTLGVTGRVPAASSPGDASGIAVAPDGRAVARVGPADTARVVALPLGRAVARGMTLSPQPAAVNAMAFAPGGAELAVGSVSGSLAVYRASGETAVPLAGHSGQVNAIGWTGTTAPTGMFTIGQETSSSRGTSAPGHPSSGSQARSGSHRNGPACSVRS
jgi:WD40 repeat protein